MVVTTKKNQLSKRQYIKFALKNIFLQQWWVTTLLLTSSISLFIYTKNWWSIMPAILLVCYMTFWWLQFYGVTRLEQNQLLFEPVKYQINGEQIVITLNTKHSMPISWKNIQHARQYKDYFILFISKAQFIYLPYKIFYSPHEIQFLSTLLKRKKLNH